jgi:hypothetical protein
MSRAAEFEGSATPCPECGSSGKNEGLMGRKVLSHCGDTPGHCHVYTWSPQGQVLAKDTNTKAQRDANADAFDARLRSLSPLAGRR